MGLWLLEKVEQTIRTSNQDRLVTLVLIRTDMVAPILHILEGDAYWWNDRAYCGW